MLRLKAICESKYFHFIRTSKWLLHFTTHPDYIIINPTSCLPISLTLSPTGDLESGGKVPDCSQEIEQCISCPRLASDKQRFEFWVYHSFCIFCYGFWRAHFPNTCCSQGVIVNSDI